MRHHIIISLYCIILFFSSYSVSNAASNKTEILQLKERIAVLNITLEGLREEIKKLSGIIAETEYRLSHKIENIKCKTDNKNKAFKNIEETIQKNQKKITALENLFIPVNTNVNNTVSKKKEINLLYNAAKNLYDIKDYEKALVNFNALIKKHPNSIYTDNCYFWIGEIFYNKKNVQTSYTSISKSNRKLS